MGAQVEQFEREFADWVGSPHAVMVNSGSSANLLAIEAMMRPSAGMAFLKAGDEVLVPALSWSTTVWPLVQFGLVPVFVDSDPETLAMDLTHARAMVSTKTRGMVVIHVLGLAMDLKAVRDFCLAHALTLVEDCCEAFGAHWAGQHVGRTGLMGTFSHYFSHQLSTIEGGMIITPFEWLADDLRSMRAHGWSRNRRDRGQWDRDAKDARFNFVTTGYNVRPLDLQAAIGQVQLRLADTDLAARDASVLTLMRTLMAHVPWLHMIGQPLLNTNPLSRRTRRHSWMNLPLLVQTGAPMARDQVVTHLEAVGVETRSILAGNLLRHPVMTRVNARSDPKGYPVADRMMRDSFMIGCHSDGIETALSAFETLRAVAA